MGKKISTTVFVAGFGITVSLIGGVGYLAYLMKKKGLLDELYPFDGPRSRHERHPDTGIHNLPKTKKKV